MSIIIYAMSGLFLCFLAVKLYTERRRIKADSPLPADLAKIFTAGIALVAVVVAGLSYYLSNNSSRTQAAINIRNRLLNSITADIRAALAIISINSKINSDKANPKIQK